MPYGLSTTPETDPEATARINTILAGTSSSDDTLIELVSFINAKAPVNSPTFTGTVSGITAAMVGLGDATNTSDTNKPVSAAQAAAIALKANIASPTFTGNVSISAGLLKITRSAPLIALIDSDVADTGFFIYGDASQLRIAACSDALSNSGERFVLDRVNGKFGYATGVGGVVTQITSRVTGVTLDKASGAITLASFAGSPTYQSFTVTNSAVSLTDTIIVNQRSGADLYMIFVTNVANGSFKISFATTGGITVEQPIFAFNVIKGATS